MSMQGDGASQPGEGVDSLSDLGDLMDTPGQEVEEAQDESEAEDETEQDDPEEEEEEQESDDPEQPAEDPTIVLKHEGKEVPLKQSEVIELAQKGFDYTSKTMAVAEERKVVQQERAKAAEFREQNEKAATETLSRLEAYTKFMESQIGTPPPVEWASTDAGYYIAQKEQYESRKGQLQQAYAETQRIQGEQARQRQAWINERAAATEEALKDTLPGWSDDTLNTLADYAGKTYGLNPQTAELAMLTPGFWQLAHKAKAYDELQAQKAQLKPQKTLPKVHTPKASNPVSKSASDQTKRIEQFDKNPKSLASLGALWKE